MKRLIGCDWRINKTKSLPGSIKICYAERNSQILLQKIPAICVGYWSKRSWRRTRQTGFILKKHYLRFIVFLFDKNIIYSTYIWIKLLKLVLFMRFRSQTNFNKNQHEKFNKLNLLYYPCFSSVKKEEKKTHLMDAYIPRRSRCHHQKRSLYSKRSAQVTQRVKLTHTQIYFQVDIYQVDSIKMIFLIVMA
jgi:hypothetical protein